MKNPSVDQHGGAPVVYLVPFSKPRNTDHSANRIQVMSRDEPITLKRIKKVDTVPYQYSILDLEGLDQDFVEKGWNDKFERPYAAVRKKLLNGQWPLIPTDRKILSDFMAMSYVKDHRRLEHIRDEQNARFLETAKDAQADDELAEKMLNFYKRSLAEIISVHTLERVEHYSKILSLRHNWILFRSPTPLITGNTPLALMNLENGDMTTSIHMGLKKFQLAMFPISRKMGIMFSAYGRDGQFRGYLEHWNGEYDASTRDKRLSTLFRKAILKSSSEIYFHPDDLAQVLRLEDFSSFRTDIQEY